MPPPWRRADAWQRRRSCGPGDPGPSESGQSQQTGRGKVTRSCRRLGGELTPALQRRRGCGPRDPGPSASVRSPRLGRPLVTARSCRRLGGALTPGSAGAAAVRETPARQRPCGDGAVMSPPRLRCHNSSLLRTYGVSAWIPYPFFCLVCPAEVILASVRRMLVCLYSLHASFITSRNSSFSAQ